jgi:hypothetical protein
MLDGWALSLNGQCAVALRDYLDRGKKHAGARSRLCRNRHGPVCRERGAGLHSCAGTQAQGFPATYQFAINAQVQQAMGLLQHLQAPVRGSRSDAVDSGVVASFPQAIEEGFGHAHPQTALDSNGEMIVNKRGHSVRTHRTGRSLSQGQRRAIPELVPCIAVAQAGGVLRYRPWCQFLLGK